jgi:hypothetical protein
MLILAVGSASVFAAAASARTSVQPAATAPAATRTEHWYEVSLGGKHAGYQHSQVIRENDLITTRQRVLLVIKRGQTEIKNSVEAETVETSANVLKSMRSRTELGGKPMVAEYTFGGDTVKITRIQDGNKLESSESLPKPSDPAWLTPAAAQTFIATRQAAGAKDFKVTTIDPAGGLEPSTDAYTLLEQANLDVSGKKVKTWKYKVVAGKPKDLEQTMWLDEKGEVVRIEMDLGGTKLITMASDRARALRATESPEIMVATFVKPTGKTKSLADARKVTQAEFLVSIPDADLPDLPVTGTQTFARRSKSSAVVTVDASGKAQAAKGDDDGALKPSAWVNSEDDEIVKETRKALASLKEQATPAEKAEAIRAHVHRFIQSKNLGSGFATASEVVRSKSGDCTEHALLTAAMLRAASIPSRVVSGLVFADQFAGEHQVFAYHMWTQARVEVDGVSRWIELDATLASQAFDATHIALVTTTLKDGEFETAMSPIAKMLGKLKVEVVRAE